MQEVTGSSPVSPTTSMVYERHDRPTGRSSFVGAGNGKPCTARCRSPTSVGASQGIQRTRETMACRSRLLLRSPALGRDRFRATMEAQHCAQQLRSRCSGPSSLDATALQRRRRRPRKRQRRPPQPPPRSPRHPPRLRLRPLHHALNLALLLDRRHPQRSGSRDMAATQAQSPTVYRQADVRRRSRGRRF